MSDNNHNMNCCVPRSVVYYIVRALNACTAVAYTNTHIHTATIHPVPSPNCRNNGLAAFTCRAVSEKKIHSKRIILPALPLELRWFEQIWTIWFWMFILGISSPDRPTARTAKQGLIFYSACAYAVRSSCGGNNHKLLQHNWWHLSVAG